MTISFQMQVKVRLASSLDLEWVNKRYREIGFMTSDLGREKILIAEVHREKAGLGRLVKIEPEVFELGGIYVKEFYRKQGIAARIVSCLLQNISPASTIYCIAFKHLSFFYQRYGFQECSTMRSVPRELQNKFKRCLKIYDNKVCFLIRIH